MRAQLPFAMLAVAFACTQFTSATHAAARDRVFVASYGSDSNPCTFGSPCRTFQQAIDTVAFGGEVTAIDSAGYGPVVILFSVTITSPPGVEAGVVPTSGSSAIVIATGGGGPGVVQLRGLTLDGKDGGTNGIVFDGTATRVEIIDCLIHNFSGNGILLNPSLVGVVGPDTVIISNTVVTDNGGPGIELNPQQTDPSLRGAFDHVITSGNSSSGIIIDATNYVGPVDIAISNSVSDGNSGDGITIAGVGNVKVEMRESTLSNNGFNGITVSKAIAGLYANSIVLNNNSGFAIANSGTINSFGNNAIESNHSSNTGTLTPVTTQ